MPTRKSLLALVLPLLLFLATGCDLFEDITKSDFEKNLSKLEGEWIVDSVRVREYGYFPSLPLAQQTPLGRDTLLPIIKMKFLRNPDAIEGKLIQTSLVNGAEVVAEYRWRYVDYLDLFYPNPNVGLSDVQVIYTVVELSENTLHFMRDENLVSETNGARYGSLSRLWKMHK